MNIFLGIMIPFAGTALGAACVFLLKNDIRAGVQKALLGFASGIMVAASVWSLLIPAMEMSESMGKLRFIPAGLTDVFAVGALVVCGHVFGLPSEDIATAATMLLAIVGFMILYKICQPMNSVRLAVFIGCIVGMIFCGVFLNQLFAMSGMSTICILLFVMFSFAAESFFRYLSILVEDVRLLVKRMRGDISKEELIHKLEGEELDR